MEGGRTEDWVNSSSAGLTKAICRVSVSITVRTVMYREREEHKWEKSLLTFNVKVGESDESGALKDAFLFYVKATQKLTSKRKITSS